MINFQVYKPQAVMLPADSDITRKLHDKRSHLPGKPPLEAGDDQCYETHTVFNDIFLDVDSKHLRAVGPPLVNLKDHLLPMRVTVTLDGEKTVLRHRLSNRDRVTFHSFVLPRALRGVDSVSTTWELANGQKTDVIAKRQQLPTVQLQFTTLQKNNPVEWVLDWLRYCESIGVQRVLLYDNNSDNIGELEAALKNTSGLPVIVLIHWPYPYGPAKSHYNHFCQASQNNHAYHCFGHSQWTGHFDVDEFLMMPSGSTLGPLLDKAPRRWGLLRFDSFWVPDVENVLSRCAGKSLPSVRDFNYRERQARGKAYKYIARNRHVKMAKTHNAKVTLGYQRKAIPASDMAFLHYKPLTDDWRGYEKRVSSEEFDGDIHIRDVSVKTRMQWIDNLNINVLI